MDQRLRNKPLIANDTAQSVSQLLHDSQLDLFISYKLSINDTIMPSNMEMPDFKSYPRGTY